MKLKYWHCTLIGFFAIWLLVWLGMAFIDGYFSNPISVITDYNELTENERTVWLVCFMAWVIFSLGQPLHLFLPERYKS